MRQKIHLLCLFIILFSSLKTYGHKDTLKSKRLEFIENKGQWADKILFKANIDGGTAYFEKEGFTFGFADREKINTILDFKLLPPEERKIKKNPDLIVNCSAYYFAFLNPEKDFKIIKGTPSITYENYFIGNQPNHWASRVNKYNEFTYENLWKGIDLKVGENNYLLKYELHLQSGANPNDISFEYKGIRHITVDAQGNLIVTTDINKIIELKPKAWVVTPEGPQWVECHYRLKGNIVSFDFPKGYNTKYELVIDPVLIFSSYSGSTTDNWGYTATYDKNGFLYAGGNAFALGYPTTLGAYQINYGTGTCDMVISKYDSIGHFLVYSTYLGGNGTEVPNSLVTNDNGEIFVLGTTGSTNYPTTSSAFDHTFHGGTPFTLTYVLQYPNGSDIVVSRLSNDGTQLLASTYLGGNGNDGLNTADTLKKNYADEVRGEIIIDKNSNVYIVSSTQSVNFPTTSGSFQPAFGGGLQDGCVIKMDAALSNIIWSSFIGGNKNDAVYSIKLDPVDDIYIAGGTSSPNFPITTGVLFPFYPGGSCDGFITHIDKSGNTILHSSYYGSTGYDQVYLLETDHKGHVYVFGQTDASGTTYIFNANWFFPGGGQFVSKLSSDLSNKIWSTAFGSGTSGPNISPTAFLVDVCNSVYLSGWGGAVNGFGGTSGLPITSNAFQNTTDNSDYYFLVIKDDASGIIYGTYFGGPVSHEHVDGGTSRFDRKGRIYQSVCAGCGSHSDFPTTANVVSNTNNSYNCNNGVIKFDFKLPIVVAEFNIPPMGCTPYTVNFNNISTTGTSTGSLNCDWNFGDGTSSTLYSPTHIYLQSGVYNIRLIVSDTGSCNSSDTVFHQLVVLSGTRINLPNDSICFGQQTQIGVLPSGGSNLTYSWYPTTGLSSTNVSNPYAHPVVTTNYTLLISNGICTDTLLQKVVVNNFFAEAGGPINACLGDTVPLHASVTGQSGPVWYQWSSNPGFTDTLNFPLTNPNLQIVVQNPQTTYYLKISNTDCFKTDSILVLATQFSITAGSDVKLCWGDTTFLQVTNLTPSVSLNYSWSPNSGIINGINTAHPMVNPLASTYYVVTANNNYGCQKKDSVLVQVVHIASNATVNNISCYGMCNGEVFVNPSGGVPPYTFLWNNGSQASQLLNLCPGNYSVIIKDSSNCQISFQPALTEPSPLVISFPDTHHVVCNGICNGSINSIVSGGTPSYQLQWISGQNTPNITNLCAGLYTLFVTDANHCHTSASVPVLDTSNFSTQGHFRQPNCSDSCNGLAWVTASSGYTPYTFLWNTNSTDDTLFQVCPGIYSVRVTENHGCLHMVYMMVPQPTPVFADTLFTVPPLCYDSCNGSIMVSASGGTPPFQYLWQNGQTNPLLQNVCQGTYIVTVSDSLGCMAKDTIIIQQPSKILLTLQSTKVPCTEICNAVLTAQVSGGVPSYTYFWSTGATTNPCTNGCFGINTLTVRDSHNCPTYGSVAVLDTSYFPTSFHCWIGNDIGKKVDTIYESRSIQLNATTIAGFHYSWSPMNGLNNPSIPNPVASPVSTTTYILTATDPFGCTKTDTVKIVVEEVICDDPFIFIPNAYTPNGDNTNEILYVRSRVISSMDFLIYDRWGEKVFESHQTTDGWDGTFKGKPCEPAVYVYYLDATCYAGKHKIKKGNITLIK